MITPLICTNNIAGRPLHSFVKKYLLEKQEHKCAICGNLDIHNDIHLILELDHIDGDATNNSGKNLRLICSNCHSQQSTSTGKNKGRGRASKGLGVWRLVRV